MRQYVEASRGRIAVEFLPAYAPEMNPVDYLRGFRKQPELADVCLHEYWRLGGDGADDEEEDAAEEEARGAVLLEAG